jgi:EAL domain-containing protein (putative c-di-GMP-specific phosphodiesterase class I)
MENAESAAQMLKRLRALGVQLSIDDFGTGYSSLSYLHRFPVNYLKIDRSFVMRMTTNNDNAIVKTISTLAHNLGMEVIAEGVETEEQCRQLKALGCEYGQGYLFSRPVNADGALLLLAADRQRDLTLDMEPISERDDVLLSTYQM